MPTTPAAPITAEARKIVSKELEEKKLKVKRTFKEKGKRDVRVISAAEKAEMMRTIIEEPDITAKEFSKRYGYQLGQNDHPSGAAIRMRAILKDEIARFQVPEMEQIIKADLIILGLSQREQISRLEDSAESMTMGEIAVAADRSFKRARLLTGGSTSKIEVDVRKVAELKEEELDDTLIDLTVLEDIKE